jgi:UDP-glucose 4-epimerase
MPNLLPIMNVLVAGGAGYIGSHCVRQLILAGHKPIVVDNLVYGHIKAVPKGTPFYTVDLHNEAELTRILKEEKIDIVMHFAAYCYVGESVTDPFKYYQNNVAATLSLLSAMRSASVLKFVFSSTCATFGIPKVLPMAEDAPQKPISPYGQTKLDVENILKAAAHAYGFSFAAFRYFNAAGAASDGSIGEDHSPETHLIPIAFDVAMGKRPHLELYGTDHPTADGTCLRDYVHVDDLSRAHIAAFNKLDIPGTGLFYNLGTGRPSSNREVISAVERVTGRKILVINKPKRPGDPATLFANSSKAKNELGWIIEYPTIDSIVRTAWAWHKNNPDGYGDKKA